MTDPYRQLQDALDALDAAFAPLSERPFTVGGCTYCYTQADLDALSGPVDRVPEDLIPHVAAEATDHWDDFPALYRRMTPRIIRRLITGQLHVDHGLIASRLLAAGAIRKLFRSGPRASAETRRLRAIALGGRGRCLHRAPRGTYVGSGPG